MTLSMSILSTAADVAPRVPPPPLQVLPVLTGRLPSVGPGARLLLRAEGKPSVCTTLGGVDAIKAQGIAPAAVSPAYWRTLGNRFAARLPAYSTERHATWLAGRALP